MKAVDITQPYFFSYIGYFQLIAAVEMFVFCYARLCGYSVEVLSVSGFKHWVGKISAVARSWIFALAQLCLAEP